MDFPDIMDPHIPFITFPLERMGKPAGSVVLFQDQNIFTRLGKNACGAQAPHTRSDDNGIKLLRAKFQFFSFPSSSFL
jgi:hypothetical protein